MTIGFGRNATQLASCSLKYLHYQTGRKYLAAKKTRCLVREKSKLPRTQLNMYYQIIITEKQREIGPAPSPQKRAIVDEACSFSRRCNLQ